MVRVSVPLRFMMALVVLLVTTSAYADEPKPKKKHAEWNDEWPRFSLAEIMVSAAVTLRNSDFGQALDGPDHATIRFEVPVLDHGARDLLRLGDQARRDGAARLSDIGFRTLVFAPYVLDVGLGALVLQRNPDLAAQLALIDFEVLTLAGMTQLLGSRVIGRARPYVSNCSGRLDDPDCQGGPYRSFLSGHTMASFTAAGLMCVHHKFLPLFDGGPIENLPCYYSLAVASSVGVLRLMADQHWASDVIIGAGLGWVYGYYLPQLLHFHISKMIKKNSDGKPSSFTWLPTFAGTGSSLQAGVLGTF